MRFFGGLIFLAMIASTCQAGVVHTLDGKNYEGDVHFEGGQVVIHPKRGQLIKLELTDVLQADFRNTEPPRPPAARAPGLLDRMWKMQDVGPTGTAGSARLIEGKFSVKGAGSNIKGTADSFYFVYQELRGDGQIIARLSDLQIINPDGKAGVMIREAFNERGSRTAFLFLKPQDGSSFAWRAEKGGEMSGTPLVAGDKPPAWLRLSRVRNMFTAYKSVDGNAWVMVGQPQEIRMDARVFVGLAVCSRDVNAACAATFEGVSMQIGTPKDDPPPKLGAAVASHPSGPMLNRAVVLRNGSIIGNVNLQSADEKNVQFTRADGKPVILSTNEVARLILAPSTPVQLSKIPPTGSGVLTARGDFFEGDFVSLQNGRVKVNSVVFGPKDLAMGGEATVVVLHEMGTSQAAWVIRTHEGFVYMARSVKIDRDQLAVDDEAAGLVKLGAGSVLEIKAGSGRFDSLVDVRPAKIEVDAGLSPATAYAAHLPGGPSINLGGLPCERAIVCQAGTSLRFSLDGTYKVFLARVGVADAILPMLAVRILVLTDGKEAYRSPPLTSMDDPVNVSVNLGGVQSMVLRVEAVGEVHLPVSAMLDEPALFK